MDAIKTHKDLLVWQKSIALAGKVYAATRRLPSDERMGLNQQLRLAAISVASNIAEGAYRRNRLEFVHRLNAARCALLEIETQTMIAIGQGYFEATTELPDDIMEMGRLLNALIREVNGATQIAHAKACAPQRSRAELQSPASNQSLPSTSSAS